MNIKKLAIGGITGGIVFFFLGWLVYGILLMDFMNQHQGITSGYQREPLFLYLIIGNLVYGLLIAYIFEKSAVSTWVSGLITGAIIGFLISCSFDFTMYATTTLLSRTAILADVLASTVMTAITGAVVALVINKAGSAG